MTAGSGTFRLQAVATERGVIQHDPLAHLTAYS
jgi:hypothetical protein